MKRDRLLKLLALTESPNDHEALSAIRMVNRALKDRGQTWGDVLDWEDEESGNDTGYRIFGPGTPRSYAEWAAGMPDHEFNLEDAIRAFYGQPRRKK